MSKYVRLTKGLVSKGQLVKEEEVYDLIGDQTNTDWYQSVFYYNDKHLEQFKKTGTVKGIKDVTTNKLVFDLDSKKSVNDSRLSALQVVDRLKAQAGVGSSDLEITFSGNKGFGIIATIDKFVTPLQAADIATRVAGDLDGFDLSLYDANQLLRVPFTKHQKSGKYKIPLTYPELKDLSIDAIFDKAKDLSNVSGEISVSEVKLPDSFYNPRNVETKINNIPKGAREVLERKPKQWRDSKWLIHEGFFDSGERHHALMVLAATLKGMGYDSVATGHMCKAAIEKQATRSKSDKFPKEELWENVITSVFDESWEGGQYSVDNDPWLKNYAIKMGVFENDSKEDSPKQIRDIEGEFTDFVMNIDENTIKTGIEWLDKEMPLITGGNLGIIGAASSGKTALALEILKNTSQAGVVSVFASLDMHRKRLYQKLLHKVSGGMSRDEIYELYRSGRGHEISDSIARDYGNVWFFDRSAPTVSDIREYVLNVEKKTGKKVKLLMVDYFERVNSNKSEDTAASKEVAGQLQDIVNDLDICLITLVQPNKFSLNGGPDSPILSYTAIKGSSFMYQAFRSIVSIWRPFFNPETADRDNYMEMAILKNDLGEVGKNTFGWTGKTGDIYNLTQTEKETFKALLKERQDEKKENKSEEWA